jgi:Spy/CpxP family protein refolding chaperone
MAEEAFVAPRQRMQQALGLDEKQVASLEMLTSERRKDAIRQGAEERIARIELEELMRAETLDQKAIDAKINQIAQLSAAPMRARVEHHLAVQKILTPEQFKKWQAMRPAFGGQAMGSRAFRGDGPRRWHDGRAPRGPRPMGPPPPDAARPRAGSEGEPVR